MPTTGSKKSQSVRCHNSAIKSKSAPSSITPEASNADIAARRAALLVEAAAMDGKEGLNKEMLALQYRRPSVWIKTELEKLQAVQRVLEEKRPLLTA